MQTIAIIMAAGEGKRMKSNTSKVLHKLCGRAMIEHVIEAVSVCCEKPIVVVGHHSEQIQKFLGDKVFYAHQLEQKGTGHAVLMARELFTGKQGQILIVAGDMPLLKKETLQKLVDITKNHKNAATVLSAMAQNPDGYGRIIRGADNQIAKVVEHVDATPEQRKICEINTSVYCFDIQLLERALDMLKNNNAQGEYYLTDCIEILAGEGAKIESLIVGEQECLGVNDRVQLAQAVAQMRKEINNQHMQNGVTMIDSGTAYIDAGVEIARDVLIYPGNVIEGKTKINTGTVLMTGNYIESTMIGEDCKIGPNAHLRPKTVLGNQCRVGNYVELKNVTVGDGAKVSHLAYCGDGAIGKKVNVSCGVIFSNYDGRDKFTTVIKDHAFIGCNANLVAPVTIEEGAYIAAGSTITQDVPERSLAIARARQQNKPGWVEKREQNRMKQKGEKPDIIK